MHTDHHTNTLWDTRLCLLCCRVGHTLVVVLTRRDAVPGDCRHSDSPRVKAMKAEQLDLKTETFSHQLSSLDERLRTIQIT